MRIGFTRALFLGYNKTVLVFRRILSVYFQNILISYKVKERKVLQSFQY